MAYKKIFEFLKKFDALFADSVREQSAVQESIREILGVEIALAQITIRGGVVYIQVRGPLKSELALKKENIISLIAQKTNKKFKDLR